MLSARYIASVSDDLIKLYTNLEIEIKQDMARRIFKLGQLTEATQWQAEILVQTGGLKTDIDRLIAKYDAMSQKLLKQAFTEALEKANRNDRSFYVGARRLMTANQRQLIDAAAKRFDNAEKVNKTFASRAVKFGFDETYNRLKRMTLTVADSCQKNFLQQCNIAYMKVSSGAFSYQQAVKSSIDYLAQNGVKVHASNSVEGVTYSGSGKIKEYSIESAVRMNVITGINQTATQQTLDNCDTLETDLVEVSAHIGARPEHEALQGQVYCLNGEREYTDADGNIKIAKDYALLRVGEPDGICGINCRHSFYPYFEGAPTMYSKGELSEMEDKRVSLDGKEVTPYEAEQELRYTEREIRYFKTKVDMYEYAGIDESRLADYQRAKDKLSEWQQRARDITEESGIKRDYSREYIAAKNGKQPRGS